jgi:phytoene dehydrogenase-like protein
LLDSSKSNGQVFDQASVYSGLSWDTVSGAIEAGEDLIPEEGMGTLAQGLASGLDIRLNFPVSAVVWDSRHGVTVRGSFGLRRNPF